MYKYAMFGIINSRNTVVERTIEWNNMYNARVNTGIYIGCWRR